MIARHAIAIGIALLVAGCEDIPQTWSESDLRELVREEAPERPGVNIGALEDRLEEIDNKLSDLESEGSTHESEIARLRTEISFIESEISSHSHY